MQAIRRVEFEADSVLLRKAQLEGQACERVALTPAETLVLLADAHFTFRTTPHDETLFEQLEALLTLILEREAQDEAGPAASHSASLPARPDQPAAVLSEVAPATTQPGECLPSQPLAGHLSKLETVSFPTTCLAESGAPAGFETDLSSETLFEADFALLQLRSLNEFGRTKRMERALQQLEELRQSYAFPKRCAYTFATPYEAYLCFVVLLADKYLKLGLSLSAVALMEGAALWEDCVDILIARGYRDKARELLTKLSRTKTTPLVLCLWGDLDSDPAKFEEAWSLSGSRFARAKRSLGWFYFGKNEWAQSLEHFGAALRINDYDPQTWFVRGCAEMRLGSFAQGSKSFAECVRIDPSQAEAWGNLASCHMHLQHWEEAFSTLAQALKHGQRNWRLWANMLTVAPKVRQFGRYLEAIETLIALDHREVVGFPVLARLSQLAMYHLDHLPRRATHLFRQRVHALLPALGCALGQHSYFWRAAFLFREAELEIVRAFNVFYANTTTLDPQDMLPQHFAREQL